MATETNGYRCLRIGDSAPNFTARSTRGPIELADYQGRWVIFFSHPADFTPVCTTEFVAIAKAASKFKARNCDLLGLSVDSLFAHLAWLRDIEARFGETINFPILEDPSMVIGRAYGMIDEQTSDSAAMRSSYFIDPDGIIRAITTYPHNVGRNVDEMLRLVAALQAVDQTGNLAPEGWSEGQQMLAPPPENLSGDIDEADWFRYAKDNK